MFKKICKILNKRQMLSLGFMTILIFIGGLFDLLGVSLILPIVNLATEPSTLLDNKAIVFISELFNFQDVRQIVIVLLAAMIAIYVIKNVYIILMYKLLYHFTYSFKKELAMRLLNCYMYQDYTFHLKKNIADLQRNILTDTGQFYGFISDFINMLNQCITCILLGGYLLIIDYKTTIGVIVLLGGAMILVYYYQRKVQVLRGEQNRESSAEVNKWIIQSFSGIKEIQVLGREDFFIKKCEEAYDKGMNANKKSNFATIVPKPLMEMICVGGLLGVVLIRLLFGADISKFVSTLAVFAVAAFRMLPCFNSISAHISSMLFEKKSVDAVFEDIKEMEKLGEKNHLKCSKN